MAEFSVRFTSKRNGYDRDEVDQFVKDVEAMLQEKAVALANLQQEVVNLETKLHKIMGDDTAVEEKVELYDKLMKKMDGYYTNLLAPAIAKAKKIEAKAEEEYNIRMDQARYCAEGIYKETADRIAGVVDDNMDRMYDLLDRFIYSRSLPGRIEAFMGYCTAATSKVARKIYGLPAQARESAQNACDKATNAVKTKVNDCRESIVAFKEDN